MSRVVVVGGGIVGASAAYHLAKGGTDTILVDRFDQGQATAAGAGIISAGSSQTTPVAVLDYAATAVPFYQLLIDELAEVGQTQTGYDTVGEMICARNDEEFAQLQPLLGFYQERFRYQNGAVEFIDGQQARALFPALGEIPGAIHIPDVARVDGASMRDALLAGARHHGATRRSGDASLMLESGSATGVTVDGERITADAVIIAGGAWTNALLKPLGVSIDVAPQRGQILHLTMPGADTSRWPIIQKPSDQYILTFGPDRVVVGATREFDSGFDYRLTVGGTRSVLDEALSIAPGLAAGSIKEWRIGFRPYSKDGLPWLGSVSGAKNVVVATGLGPSGLTLGPYSGMVAAQLATGSVPDVDLASFSISRASA